MKTVTIVTAASGNKLIKRCIESVRKQTYQNITHLVVIDGVENLTKIDFLLADLQFSERYENEYRIILPWSIGKDRWNGHRIYAASTYIIESDYVMYLDEDNYLDPDHVEECIKTIERGNDWCFSFRKIVNAESKFICNDDCESLGKWSSILDENDYFVDVACYFLPKSIAVKLTPFWYRKAREPGEMEVDRLLAAVLRQNLPKYDSTYKYSVNYNVGNNPLSVQGEFFLNGNKAMLQKHNGKLPWKHSIDSTPEDFKS